MGPHPATRTLLVFVGARRSQIAAQPAVDAPWQAPFPRPLRMPCPPTQWPASLGAHASHPAIVSAGLVRAAVGDQRGFHTAAAPPCPPMGPHPATRTLLVFVGARRSLAAAQPVVDAPWQASLPRPLRMPCPPTQWPASLGAHASHPAIVSAGLVRAAVGDQRGFHTAAAPPCPPMGPHPATRTLLVFVGARRSLAAAQPVVDAPWQASLPRPLRMPCPPTQWPASLGAHASHPAIVSAGLVRAAVGDQRGFHTAAAPPCPPMGPHPAAWAARASLLPGLPRGAGDSPRCISGSSGGRPRCE